MLFPFLGIDLLSNTSDALNLISILLTIAVPILGAVVSFLKMLYYKKFYDALFSSLGTNDPKDKERYRLSHYVKHTFTRITTSSSSNSVSFKELIKTLKKTKITIFIGSAGVGKSKLMQRLAFKFRSRIQKGTKGEKLSNYNILFYKLTGEESVKTIVEDIKRDIGNSQVEYTLFLDGLDEMSGLNSSSGDEIFNELIRSILKDLSSKCRRIFISLRPEILNKGYSFLAMFPKENIVTFKVNNFNEDQIKAMYRSETRIKIEDGDKKAKQKDRKENYKKLKEVIKNNHQSVFTYPLILTWAKEILSDGDVAELKLISWYDALGKVIDKELERECLLYCKTTVSDYSELRDQFIKEGWEFLQDIAIKMTRANTQIVAKESILENAIVKRFSEMQGETTGNTFVARHLLRYREWSERENNQTHYEFIHNSIFWRVLADVVLYPDTPQDLRTQIILNQSGKSTEMLEYCRQGLWTKHKMLGKLFPYLNYTSYMWEVGKKEINCSVKQNVLPLEIILSSFYGLSKVTIDYAITFNSTRIKEFVEDRKLDLSNCANIGDMSLLKSFGSNSFDFLDCSNSDAVKAVIPNYIKKIDLRNCTSLTGVYITDLVAWCNIEMDYASKQYIDSNVNSVQYSGDFEKDLNEVNLYLNDELITDLVIPDGVTKINDFVFASCSVIKHLHLPDSLISIGGWTFFKCTSLIDVVIPDNIAEIGEGAFYGCNAIKTLTIGKEVKRIGASAFNKCSDLTEINYNATECCDVVGNRCIVDGGITVGVLYEEDNKDGILIYDVFRGAGVSGDGVAVNIGANVKRIPIGLFNNSTSISIPNMPFDEKNVNKITSVNFQKDSECECIDDFAFCACRRLKTIIIPDSVSIIRNLAFNNSAIERIYMGSKLESIGRSAFIGCSSLVDISVSNENKNYKSIDGNLYSKDGMELILYCKAKTEQEFVIPDGVTKIGNCAFNSANNLVKVIAPYGVTVVGERAFSECSSMANITLQNSVVKIEKEAFQDSSNLKTIIYNGTMQEWNNIDIDKDAYLPDEIVCSDKVIKKMDI